MSDIEKIQVNGTAYDIKDAKALHNKALATTSIVEEKSGTTSYPSNSANNTNNVILGNGAYVTNASARNAVVIGSSAKFSYNSSSAYYATGVGYNCTCGQNYATAIGSQAYAYTNGTALGASASTGSFTNNTVVGYSASGGAAYATALGGGAKAYKSYDVALGYNAITNGDSNSIQIGSGTNINGGLQVRSWQLLDNQGIIPIERIPTDLVVTTTDPLPDPNALSIGTTQMYLGEDTDIYKKNHMYSVQEDRASNCIFVMPYNSQTIANFDPIKNIKLVDKEKLYNAVTNHTGLHGGKQKDISSTGLWNNRYIPLYYNPSTDKFYLGASYEYKVETLYYDYTNGSPELTLSELENDYGIKIEGWDNITKPTYTTSFAYIVLNSRFCVKDVYNPDYNNRFELYARMGYDKLKQWCESPIRYSDSGIYHQYQMKDGDKIEIRWYANASVNPDEGGAWWLVLYKPGDTHEYSISPPQDGQHSLYNYWTTDELKRDWGITDVGQGLYAGRTYINKTTFTVCWVYGNRWVESSNVYTAGQGINISSDNVISTTVTGGGNSMSGIEVTDGYILPETFQAIEYIQNTGTEVIVVPRDYTLKSDTFTIEFDFRDVGSTSNPGSLLGTVNNTNNSYYRINRGNSTSRFTLTEDGSGGTSIGISGTFFDNAHGGYPTFDNLPIRRIDQDNSLNGYFDFINVIGNRYVGFNAINIGNFALFGLKTIASTSSLTYSPSMSTYRIYRYIQRDEYGNITVYMIPVIRTIDNVVGMYDFVSKQFCTSITTPNNFIAGPIKDYHNGITAGSKVFYDKNFETSINKDGKVFIRLDTQYGDVLSKRTTNTNITGTIYEAHSSTPRGSEHQHNYQTVIGYGAEGGAEGATVYGYNAQASNSSVAVGNNARTEMNTNSTVVGYNSQATGGYDVAVGSNAKATGHGYGVAIGYNSKIYAEAGNPSSQYCVVIGYGSTATRAGNIAIGINSSATNGPSSIAIGREAKTSAETTVAIGCQAKSTADSATAIGYGSQANSGNSVSIGQYAIVNNNCVHSIQLGTGTNSTANKFKVWNYELLDKTTGKIPSERFDITVDEMTGATSSSDGASGLVPAPSAGDQNKYLKGDGTWGTVQTVTSLSALTDTSINNPQAGQSLVYRNGSWVNAKAGVQVTYDEDNKRLTFA